MSALESTKKLLRRWFTSLVFWVLLSLALGVGISFPLVPQPKVAIIPISGVIFVQAHTDAITEALKQARKDRSIRAVVLKVDSPGGYVVTTEAIYLDVLRLKQKKPVVASVGMRAASGGYYIAVAADFIYATPTSQVGSIGAAVDLPTPAQLEEDVLTSGLFKATGGSKRKAVADLEMVKQEFVAAIMLHRGDRLKLSLQELSRAEVYLGVEGLKYGLIDAIGTITDAIEKAASLAGVRNYEIKEISIPESFGWSWFSSLEDLNSLAGLMPVYYYLSFEAE